MQDPVQVNVACDWDANIFLPYVEPPKQTKGRILPKFSLVSPQQV